MFLLSGFVTRCSVGRLELPIWWPLPRYNAQLLPSRQKQNNRLSLEEKPRRMRASRCSNISHLLLHDLLTGRPLNHPWDPGQDAFFGERLRHVPKLDVHQDGRIYLSHQRKRLQPNLPKREDHATQNQQTGVRLRAVLDLQLRKRSHLDLRPEARLSVFCTVGQHPSIAQKQSVF